MSQAPALPSAFLPLHSGPGSHSRKGSLGPVFWWSLCRPRDGIRFAQGLVESRRLSFELEFGGQREDGLLLESDRGFSGTACLGW